ncbi:MAG: hypothetical protein V1753_03395, partial [Pseudomonadota bacterium]
RRFESSHPSQFKVFNSINKISDIEALLHNDFEGLVFNTYPELALIRKRLIDKGASGALLSGSGSTVFGIFSDQNKAEIAYNAMKSHNAMWQVFLTRSKEDGFVKSR